MMNRMVNILASRLLAFVSPEPDIGGLEIGDNLIRYAFLRGQEIKTAFVRLPPGVLESGRIADAARFRQILEELRQKITPSRTKKIYVVVSIPENVLYAHVFTLPAMANENLREAVELNLQIVSPSDYAEVYADWQRLGEGTNEAGQIEILGAFAPRGAVDEFIASLGALNFVAVAIEPGGLALARVLDIKNEERLRGALAVRLTGDGLTFFIVRRGYLYFSRFVPWPSAEMKKILLEEMIVREVGRVVTFYASHWPGALGVILYRAPTPVIGEIMRRSLEGKFSAPVHPLGTFLWPALGKAGKEEFLIAVGSALRGRKASSRDRILNIMSEAGRQEFRRQELFNFLRVWRTAALTILVFFIGVFALADIFLVRLTSTLILRQAQERPVVGRAESREMEDAKARVNRMVALTRTIRERRRSMSALLGILRDEATSEIIMERIFVQGENLPLVINAKAPTEQSIVTFKENLAQNPAFTGIDLPLSGIARTAEGTLSFSVSVKVEPSIFRMSAAEVPPPAPASPTSTSF